MFGKGDEHVLVDADLAEEVEVPLLVGVEVVQIEVDLGDGLPDRRRFGGRQQGAFRWSSAPLRRSGRRCAGANWDLRRLRRGGPVGGEKRGSSRVGERDRRAGVYGVASVLGDQADVLQPP
jgi:hypothetical protein